MPGRFFLTDPTASVAAHLDAQPGDIADSPRFNVSPGENIIVCPEDKVLKKMRWGIIPVGRVNARGRPVMETVINARSETVFQKSAFDGVRRCLLPTNGWYEWTGEKRRKTAWRIQRKDGQPIVFAGIYDAWKAPNGVEILQVATLTCEPSKDVRDIHHRMGVILDPDQFDPWLNGPQDEAAALMQTYPDGRLTHEEASDIDWDKP